MKILALEKENHSADWTEFAPLLAGEAARVWDLYCQGVLRELYFAAGQHTAVLVMECEDASAARLALESLPLVQAGLISFDLIPLVPYDGFVRLFSRKIS